MIHLLVIWFELMIAPKTGVGGASRDGNAEMKSTKSFRFLCEVPSMCIAATMFCFMSTTLFFTSLPSSLNMSFLIVFSITVLSITSNSNPTLDEAPVTDPAVENLELQHRVQIHSTVSAQDNAGKPELSGYIIDEEHDVVINDTSELITFLFLFHHPNKVVSQGLLTALDSMIHLLAIFDPTKGYGRTNHDGKAEMKSTKSFRFLCEVPSICIPATMFCFMSTTRFFRSLPSSPNISFLTVFSMTVLSITSNSNPTLRNNIEFSMSCIVFQIVATDDPILLIALKKSSTGSATKSLVNEGYFQAAALVLNAPGMGMELDLLPCQANWPQIYGLSSKITSRLYDTLACYMV
ncbi:hypothetical protein H5410_053412 [Solanum commersonii]|uniref:Uncharacterized protein n=1 Tax=Solanum commersonii TaxID=4109 RepID=A0A9J5X3F3_SOLCO|nr:hypothetical protein H5410_053412 [Solanum commersonii]